MSQFPDIISFPCDCSKNKTWTCNRPTWNLSVSPPEMWDWVQTPQAAPTSLGLAAVSSTAPHLSHTQSRHGFPCFSSHCHPLSACWAFVFANIFSWGVQTRSPHSVPCISHISFLFLDLASRSWAPGNHPDSPSQTFLPTAFSTEILSSMGSDICFPFYYFSPHIWLWEKNEEAFDLVLSLAAWDCDAPDTPLSPIHRAQLGLGQLWWEVRASQSIRGPTLPAFLPEWGLFKAWESMQPLKCGAALCQWPILVLEPGGWPCGLGLHLQEVMGRGTGWLFI